jgi:L-aspartate oxidase
MVAIQTDFLVIGSGLAGLTYALKLAPHGSVTLLTKRKRTDANSSWAQGGIAGVLADDDSFALHVQDTLIAGAGLCNESAVEILVREGPERILNLITLGANFDTSPDDQGNPALSLGREGGHSRNRIVHTADYTGWECERTLLEAVRRTPQIEVLEHLFVIDLLLWETAEGVICAGAIALDGQSGEHTEFQARATLLATGGCGQVYQHTTNPLVATGDGVAMAWRAGVEIANMEFIQFHPTTLYHAKARAFLITEALRGEGAILRNTQGEAFMARYHPLADLAPRDIVARSIVQEIKATDAPCVYLDATHIPLEKLQHHFPTVYERCLQVGIDIAKEPIPVVPAQHYQCGGVVTDLEGATSLPRLYAAGEVACTGVHGANRLASNSLLEAMVFAYRAAEHTLQHTNTPLPTPAPRANKQPAQQALSHPSPALADLQKQIVRQMQNSVGIVRTSAELERVEAFLQTAQASLECQTLERVEDYEVRNILQVALLIVQSAQQRKESRGLHYIRDYPEPVESERHDTILKRNS